MKGENETCRRNIYFAVKTGGIETNDEVAVELGEVEISSWEII
jgi:hypothetical protein